MVHSSADHLHNRWKSAQAISVLNQRALPSRIHAFANLKIEHPFVILRFFRIIFERHVFPSPKTRFIPRRRIDAPAQISSVYRRVDQQQGEHPESIVAL